MPKIAVKSIFRLGTGRATAALGGLLLAAYTNTADNWVGEGCSFYRCSTIS